MSLLVINAREPVADDKRARQVSALIMEIVRRARFDQQPIAHIHPAAEGNPTALPIPIGRYDLVFLSESANDLVPSGLIEFILRSPSKVIDVVGAAQEQQFDQLSGFMKRAGYKPRIDPQAIVTLDA